MRKKEAGPSRENRIKPDKTLNYKVPQYETSLNRICKSATQIKLY